MTLPFWPFHRNWRNPHYRQCLRRYHARSRKITNLPRWLRPPPSAPTNQKGKSGRLPNGATARGHGGRAALGARLARGRSPPAAAPNSRRCRKFSHRRLRFPRAATGDWSRAVASFAPRPPASDAVSLPCAGKARGSVGMGRGRCRRWSSREIIANPPSGVAFGAFARGSECLLSTECLLPLSPIVSGLSRVRLPAAPQPKFHSG